MPGYFANQTRADFENKIGFIPLFPVPSLDYQTSTLMGGWELAIPTTSDHKALAWKLIEAILDPEILGPWIQEYRLPPHPNPSRPGTNSQPIYLSATVLRQLDIYDPIRKYKAKHTRIPYYR